jgi:IS5 family transposase
MQYSPEVQILAQYLPDRKKKSLGPSPIPKEALIYGLLFWLRTGCPWRYVPHSATVRRYFLELQRRGFFLKLMQTLFWYNYRPQKAIIDATNINTWRGAPWSQYSAKYHNHCIKLTVVATPLKRLLEFFIDPGAVHDSRILDKNLYKWEKLPYELYADKGYESYTRRRKLQKNNCQVRMEQKKYSKNRKRGPHFTFTYEHLKTRLEIERYFGHFKRFSLFRFFRFRKISVCKMALYCALLLTFHH